MGLVTQVADAVVDVLNAKRLSQSFTARRFYMPIFELPEMQTLHISVVPKGMKVQQVSRHKSMFDIQIDVAVQWKFSSGESDELDPLLELVEEIAELFRGRPLEGVPNSVWVGTEHAPLYAQEHMDALRQFTSVLTVTFRIFGDARSMNNIVMRKITLTNEYTSVSNKNETVSVEISCPPSNTGNVFFLGDDGATDVPWIPGEYHSLQRINLAELEVKGNPGDIITLVGGTW